MGESWVAEVHEFWRERIGLFYHPAGPFSRMATLEPDGRVLHPFPLVDLPILVRSSISRFELEKYAPFSRKDVQGLGLGLDGVWRFCFVLFLFVCLFVCFDKGRLRAESQSWPKS